MYKVLRPLFDKDNSDNKFYPGDIVDFEDEKRATPLVKDKVIEEIVPYVFKSDKKEDPNKKTVKEPPK